MTENEFYVNATIGTLLLCEPFPSYQEASDFADYLLESNKGSRQIHIGIYGAKGRVYEYTLDKGPVLN
jgi:hypothetical protein